MSDEYFELGEAREGAEVSLSLRESSENKTDTEVFQIGEELFRYFLTRDPKDAARKYASKTIPEVVKTLVDIRNNNVLMCEVLTQIARIEFANMNASTLNVMCSHFSKVVPEIMEVFNWMQEVKNVSSKKEVLILAEESPYILSFIIIASRGGLSMSKIVTNGQMEPILKPNLEQIIYDDLEIIKRELKNEKTKLSLSRIHSVVLSQITDSFKRRKIESGCAILSKEAERAFDKDIAAFLEKSNLTNGDLKQFFEITETTLNLLRDLETQFEQIEKQRNLEGCINFDGIKVRLVELLTFKYQELDES